MIFFFFLIISDRPFVARIFSEKILKHKIWQFSYWYWRRIHMDITLPILSLFFFWLERYLVPFNVQLLSLVYNSIVQICNYSFYKHFAFSLWIGNGICSNLSFYVLCSAFNQWVVHLLFLWTYICFPAIYASRYWTSNHRWHWMHWCASNWQVCI